MDNYDFCNNYQLFLSIFDTKIYRVHIFIKKDIKADTSLHLLATCHIIDINKDECIINKCYEIKIETEDKKDYVDIYEYNDAVCDIRNMLIEDLNKELNEFVQTKYTTGVKVDIKNSGLNRDLINLFNYLLLIEH